MGGRLTWLLWRDEACVTENHQANLKPRPESKTPGYDNFTSNCQSFVHNHLIFIIENSVHNVMSIIMWFSYEGRLISSEPHIDRLELKT